MIPIALTIEVDSIALTAFATFIGAVITALVTYRNKRADEHSVAFQGGAVMYDAFTKTLMADNQRLREENAALLSEVKALRSS